MPISDGDYCPGCGLPNYAGLCPYCSGNEQAYMDELYPYFGEVYEGQAEKFGLTNPAPDAAGTGVFWTSSSRCAGKAIR